MVIDAAMITIYAHECHNDHERIPDLLGGPLVKIGGWCQRLS
jgi:hypothetical protein